MVLVPLHVRIAPAVGMAEVDAGHRFQFAVAEAETGALPYVAMLAHTGGIGEFHLLPALLGDDIDDSGDGIAAVERRGGAFHNLDALYVGGIQLVEVVLSADVPVHAFAVYHDEDIVVVQSVELDVAAHIAVMEGEGRAETAEKVVDAARLVLLQCFSCEHFCLHGGVFQIVFGSRTCYHYFVEQ